MTRISLNYLRLVIRDQNYKTIAVQSSILGGWLMRRNGRQS